MWLWTIVVSVVIVGGILLIHAFSGNTSPEERLRKTKEKELRRCRRMQKRYLREIRASVGHSGLSLYKFYALLEEWLKN